MFNRKVVGQIRFVLAIAVLLCLIGSFQSVHAVSLAADILFIVDATSSMGGEIAAVQAGLGTFATGLAGAGIDATFGIVLFGGAPELVLDFTASSAATVAAFNLISVGGAVPGFQNNHNVNPEAGLEAIRITLGAATNNTLADTNVGGAVGGMGPVNWRAGVRKNIILVTDEDSDSPFYGANRVAGQSGFGLGDGDFGNPPSPLTAGWQTEIDNTAQAVINNNAFLNLLINPGDVPSQSQYGDPNQDVSDPDFLNYDPNATLAGLVGAGFGNSIEAQVLNAGLLSRSFNINLVNNADFIDNFFAAKIEEILSPPVIPEPSTYLLFAVGILGIIGIGYRQRKKVA